MLRAKWSLRAAFVGLLGCGLDDRGFLESVQRECGAHPTSYLIGARSFLAKSKAAMA
jgi:hypothetical protein